MHKTHSFILVCRAPNWPVSFIFHEVAFLLATKCLVSFIGHKVAYFFYWPQSSLFTGHKAPCLFYWPRNGLFVDHKVPMFRKVALFVGHEVSYSFVGHEVTCLLITMWPMRLHCHYFIHCCWPQNGPCV